MSDLNLPHRRRQPQVNYLLALDLGTKCGNALFVNGQYVAIDGATWNLTPKKGEHRGQRFNSFLEGVKSLTRNPTTTAIAFEEIQFPHRSTAAAAVYHGMAGVLQRYCYEWQIPVVGIPTGTIKKRATTKGNADKAMMMQAYTRETGLTTDDDNLADAYWVGRSGLDHFKIQYRGVSQGIPF